MMIKKKLYQVSSVDILSLQIVFLYNKKAMLLQKSKTKDYKENKAFHCLNTIINLIDFYKCTKKKRFSLKEKEIYKATRNDLNYLFL